MRMLDRNKLDMRFALQRESVPVYERDENGEILYCEVDGERVPIETGETESVYGRPESFRARISQTLTEAQRQAFGIDNSSVSAIITADKGLLPFQKGTCIWRTSCVKYKDAKETVVDEKSADYIVVGIRDTALSEESFLLQEVVKKHTYEDRD